MFYNDRSATASVGPRAALIATLIVFGLAFPATAQNSAPDAGTFVGLPPPSTLIGPLRLLPNGTIAVVPESTRPPAPHPPAHASAPPKLVGPPENIVAKQAVTVVKPPTPPATPSGPAPPPRATIVSQIHNAPGSRQVAPTFKSNISNARAWQSNHAYAAGQEVNTKGGAGLTGTRGYKALTSGTSCPSGGPTGTGSNIVDCGVTWQYLSDIDYTSISLWLQHGIPLVSIAQPWAQNEHYALYDTITTTNTSPGQLYVAVKPGTSCPNGTGPSGKGVGISDCGVTWNWVKTFAPPATLVNAEVNNMKGNYVGLVWNGGEYLNDGSTLNASPYYPGYGQKNVTMFYHYQSAAGGGEGTVAYNDPYTFKYTITLTAAPGESIFDNPGNRLSYDPTKGVAIRCTRLPSNRACLAAGDRGAKISRIQIKSDVQGIDASGNNNWIDKVLVDAEGDGIWSDNGSTISNSVIYAGTVGLNAKYRVLWLNDTVFGKTGAIIGAIQGNHPSFTGPPILANTTIMGFAYGCAYSPGLLPDTPGFETVLPPSDYNATDVSNGGAQDGTTGITWTRAGITSPPATSMPCPGTHSLFNVPFTTANFANTKNGSYDARLVSGSALQGAGAQEPTYNVTGNSTGRGITSDIWSLITYPRTGCPITSGPDTKCLIIGQGITGPGMPDNTVVGPGPLSGTVKNMPLEYGLSNNCDNSIGSGCGSSKTNIANYNPLQGNDIFGTPRPQDGHYDIGAWQRCATTGADESARCAFRLPSPGARP